MTSPTPSSSNTALPPPYSYDYPPPRVLSPRRSEDASFTGPALITLPSPPPASFQAFLPSPAAEPTVIGTTVPIIQPGQPSPTRSVPETTFLESAVGEGTQSSRTSYPGIDPYVIVLTHTEQLKELCQRCSTDDAMRTLHMGELIVALVKLLRKARELRALDLEEEHEQIRELLSSVERIIGSQDASAAATRREVVWNRVSVLLTDIQKRVAEEHLFAGIREARNALDESRTALARRGAPRNARR